MSERETYLEIPNNIERYLATLSKLYANAGLKYLQEIIVNSQVLVQEKWSSDNWNGGEYGHALFLTIPESIYISNVNQKTEIQNDLNKLHNVQNEFIEQVFLEMEVKDEQDWRKESGLLMAGKRIILPDTLNRILGELGRLTGLKYRIWKGKMEKAE